MQRRILRSESNHFFRLEPMRQHQLELLRRCLRRPPLHHVGHRRGRHARNQVIGAAVLHRIHAREEMPSPTAHGLINVHIGEGLSQSARDRGNIGTVAVRQPLSQNAMRGQAAPRNGVELHRIKQTGGGRADGRRRVDYNYIELLLAPFEVAPSVIDYDVRIRRCQYLLRVFMKIWKDLRDCFINRFGLKAGTF